MKTNGFRKFRLAAIAAGALLCVSASQAFAGLELVGSGTSGSWYQTWTVNSSSGIGNVTGPFNRIVATNAGAVSYTVTAGSFTISAPSLFEDNGASGAHRAWTAFGAIPLPDGFSDSSWTQTIPSGSGASNVGTTTAAGNQVFGSGLTFLRFTLNLTGLENSNTNTDHTNGAHYFLDFFNGTSLVTRYEIKDIINAANVQGLEITQIASVPLPSAAWMGLAMLGGMGAFLANRRRNRNVLA